MTIKDIARESGFAVGTVSRALNNAPGISEDTRRRIMEVVNRHNYEPNANAKHLKQQANDGIVLIVKGIQNMLFAGILEQLQSEIANRGYVPTVYYIDEEANEVAQARRICAERKPYGIMFLGSNLEYFTTELESLRIPCVLLTNSAASLQISNLSSVTVDDMAAADRMIEYLYDHGHRRIGVIGGYPNLSRPSLSRLAGVQSAMLRLDCRSPRISSMPMRAFPLQMATRRWSICWRLPRILPLCLPCRILWLWVPYAPCRITVCASRRISPLRAMTASLSDSTAFPA